MSKWLVALALAFYFWACDGESVALETLPEESHSLFGNVDEYVLDEKNHEIKLSQWEDSLEILSLTSLGGVRYYAALDEDLIDPELDWNARLDSGAILVQGKDGFPNVVVLDYKNRVLAVWQIKLPEVCSSSSSRPNSSSTVTRSSSSSFTQSSSSFVARSSSSVLSSSSEKIEGKSSSSKKFSSSSSLNVSSSSEISSSSIFTESSSSEEVVVESSSSEDFSSSSIYAPQLPGSDFSERVDSFWGTTSDAMATAGKGTYKVLIDYTVNITSEVNAVFEDSKLTLTTRAVKGRSLGIDGGWKMAGGFYFAGSYSGEDAASIYVADNKDAGADNRPANFSQYMKHGRPFTGRPKAFSVSYAYEHYENANEDYPQSSLIYVMLLSADKKVIAAGAIMDSVSIDSLTTKTVDLVYGSDAGLVEACFPGTENLSVGTGDEAVAEIRVMFASSAYAFVADGGTSSQMKAKFRGGENSKLIVDEFKLIY